MAKLLPLLMLALVLAGCVGQSSDAQKSKASEFSAKGFEEEMIKAGKQKELEEAKKRQEEYLKHGQGGGASQEGPVDPGG
jgi:hypothetical protein